MTRTRTKGRKVVLRDALKPVTKEEKEKEIELKLSPAPPRRSIDGGNAGHASPPKVLSPEAARYKKSLPLSKKPSVSPPTVAAGSKAMEEEINRLVELRVNEITEKLMKTVEIQMGAMLAMVSAGGEEREGGGGE